MFYVLQQTPQKKRAWEEYMHPYGTLKVLLCRFSGENCQIWGFGCLSRSVPVGCKYCHQALFEHFSGGLTIQDALPHHIGWFLKFCISAIFCPKMASNTPKWGICRNFCRYFDGHGHSTDVRTYLILCRGVYQVYLKNFNPLTPGCAPHCGVRVAETPKTPNFGRKSRFCRNFA